MKDTDGFSDIHYKIREYCAVCSSRLDEPIIELPNFPLTGIYTKERVEKKVGCADQKFHLCKKCGHGQLSHIINPEFVYGKNYFFRTTMSSTAVKVINDFLSFINSFVKEKKFRTIVDVGCNDLYMLKELSSKAKHLIGIDPVLKGKEKELSNEKFKVYGDFFENVIQRADLLLDDDLVLSSHTLEHVPEPKLFIKQLLNNATQNTLFGFQFPCLEALLENYRFDQIFHQHINYFSLKSVLYMLHELGVELIDFKINNRHYGTMMILFKKKSQKETYGKNDFSSSIVKFSNQEISKRYALFQETMRITNERLQSFKNRDIYGYGASLMLPVLSYHLKNDFSCLKCIIDDDKNKDGLYYLNLPVIIRYSNKIDNFVNAVILITAITPVENVRKIVSKLISMNVWKIILPLTVI